MDEFVSYRLNMQMSYNWLVLLLVLYRRHRLEHNSEYYLEQVYRELSRYYKKERKLTLNADSIVLDNQLYPPNKHGNFYGVYNSPKVLQCEAGVGLSLHYVARSLKEEGDKGMVELESLEQLVQKVKEIEVEEMSDFGGFAFQEKPLVISKESNGTEMQQHRGQLANWKCLTLLRAHAGQLASKIVGLIRTGAQFA